MDNTDSSAHVNDLLGELDKAGLVLRLRWDVDPDPDLSYLDQVDEDGKKLFEDVDRDRLVSLMASLQKKCCGCGECDGCGEWSTVAVLCGIDMYGDEMYGPGTFAIGEAMRHTNYQGTTACEMVSEYLAEVRDA